MPDPILAVAQSLPPQQGIAPAIDHHLELAALAASAGATLLVFPELSLTGYRLDLSPADVFRLPDRRLDPLQACADEHQLTLVIGAPVPSRESQGLHIGAVVLSPRQVPRTYLKVHLHPGEDAVFVPGPTTAPLHLGSAVVGLAICADITHPEHAAAASEQGCTVYAAGCFLTPQGYAADAALLRGYAGQHRLAVLLANFGGPSGSWASAGSSAIWSPAGELLVQGPAAGAAVLLARRTRGGWQTRTFFPSRPAFHSV